MRFLLAVLLVQVFFANTVFAQSASTVADLERQLAEVKEDTTELRRQIFQILNRTDSITSEHQRIITKLREDMADSLSQRDNEIQGLTEELRRRPSNARIDSTGIDSLKAGLKTATRLVESLQKELERVKKELMLSELKFKTVSPDTDFVVPPGDSVAFYKRQFIRMRGQRDDTIAKLAAANMNSDSTGSRIRNAIAVVGMSLPEQEDMKQKLVEANMRLEQANIRVQELEDAHKPVSFGTGFKSTAKMVRVTAINKYDRKIRVVFDRAGSLLGTEAIDILPFQDFTIGLPRNGEYVVHTVVYFDTPVNLPPIRLNTRGATSDNPDEIGEDEERIVISPIHEGYINNTSSSTILSWSIDIGGFSSKEKIKPKGVWPTSAIAGKSMVLTVRYVTPDLKTKTSAIPYAVDYEKKDCMMDGYGACDFVFPVTDKLLQDYYQMTIR